MDRDCHSPCIAPSPAGKDDYYAGIHYEPFGHFETLLESNDNNARKSKMWRFWRQSSKRQVDRVRSRGTLSIVRLYGWP